MAFIKTIPSRRAGFDPDENRNLVNFQKRPPVEKTLLGR